MMNNGSDIMHEIGTAILYRALSIGLSYNFGSRSEEHTSELQSQSNLVCRLLLEKKIQNRQPDPRLTRAEDDPHLQEQPDEADLDRRLRPDCRRTVSDPDASECREPASSCRQAA